MPASAQRSPPEVRNRKSGLGGLIQLLVAIPGLVAVLIPEKAVAH